MEENNTNIHKIISLYKFMQEYAKLKNRIICNENDYMWKLNLQDIDIEDPNIELNYNDVYEDEESVCETVLKVHKPEFQKCPQPNISFISWLNAGWDNYKNEVEYKLEIINPDDKELVEKFEDNTQRVDEFKLWLEKRNKWVENQIKIQKTRQLFMDLYMRYVDLQRNTNALELIAANGYIKDNANPNINHPILTKKLSMVFEPETNTIFVNNTFARTELYTELFQIMQDINLIGLEQITEDLRENDYHPLDRNSTSEFLKILVHKLSSDSEYIEKLSQVNSNNRILMIFKPTLIMRKQLDGTAKVIEEIVKNVEETGHAPKHLIDIVSGGKIERIEEKELTVEESLANTGGESIDILLSKEANNEQLEIAKRIEKYNAVIVQGPPGTGKTHTIANLIGHFLAQGKSVLVTSQTDKALSVLKYKLPQDIQSLCVSVLDDTNKDMEKSIDGITEYMAKTTSFELKKQMIQVGNKRKEIIDELGKIRNKIYNIINNEYKSIVIGGEAISPIEAAKFVKEHSEDLNYISGEVELYAPLPLTNEEFKELYETNNEISLEDEKELTCKLPTPECILEPKEFQRIVKEFDEFEQLIKEIFESKHWQITYNDDHITINTEFGKLHVSSEEDDTFVEIKKYISDISCEEWIVAACCAGKRGGSYKYRWELLLDIIQKNVTLSEKFLGNYFGMTIKFKNEDYGKYVEALNQLKKKFEQKGKITHLDIMFNNNWRTVLEEVQVNNSKINSARDCEYVLAYIDLLEYRKKLAKYWDELLAKHGAVRFYELDDDEPEMVAARWVGPIKRYLNWYDNEYKELEKCLGKIGIHNCFLINDKSLEKDSVQIENVFNFIENKLNKLLEIVENYKKINVAQFLVNETLEKIRSKIYKSEICERFYNSIMCENIQEYSDTFEALEKIYSRQIVLEKRNILLSKLSKVAPDWANDIRHRYGIHGRNKVPNNIREAWKYKQYNAALDQMGGLPLDELQRQSKNLSQQYRKTTEEYAAIKAWYYLLTRTECDISIKQALKGWGLTIKKIGRSTGKNASKYKEKAQELMAQCQDAVPCWIMSMNKALNTLKVGENRFDVIIVDEASKSDITGLTVTHFADKLIVVGDDKQVNPMSIGIEVDKISSLEQIYLKNTVPNSHLYCAKTSLYDIAATTFQPLMLKEHFRCVPEIIGYSNMLSYNYKIKPLRDAASSNLLPAFINYRVNGVREGKINRVEALTIIAYIKACIQSPEYDGKTFGIISLLGEEQVKLIKKLLFKYVEPRDIEIRNINVGTPSEFQGDERDVIFLSLVDSPNGEGPLTLQREGVEDANKKRYNVAVSRARDQVWVVNSLDPAYDLKPNDIRKQLLDYATNPKAYEIRKEEIKTKSESIFEQEVSTKLVDIGYNIIQQYPIGAYRVDMIVQYKNRKVVIECDGEKYHSSEEKILEDMQRQAILERIGWKFIRIRGGQYFRDPEGTIKQVIDELNMLEIFPEDVTVEHAEENETLDKLKQLAAEILKGLEVESDNESEISFALNDRNKLKII